MIIFCGPKSFSDVKLAAETNFMIITKIYIAAVKCSYERFNKVLCMRWLS